MDPPADKKELLLLGYFRAGTFIFFALGIKLQYWLFLGIKPASLQTGVTSCFPGSPACQLQILGLN